jgi:hypothetical protein
MNHYTVSNDRIRITFAKSPFEVRTVINLRTRQRVCRSGKQFILIRTPNELFEPVLMTRVKRVSRLGGSVEFQLTDDTTRYEVTLRVEPTDVGIRFRCTAKAPKPIWLVEWRMSGLELEKVIVPALGGQALTRSMPVETTLSYKYPFWWNAQFAIGATKQGGIWLHSRDAGPRLKLLRVRKEQRDFSLTYGFEAEAPLRSKTLEGEWYIDAFAGSWKQPADIHRQWIERAFNPIRFTRNPDAPAWVGDINFVLEMWGITKDRPEPLHTFEDMERRLRAWRKLHDPRRTLVYLPGFAMHGIDSQAPDYFPSEQLGGTQAFNKLVQASHRMGYRVMVHTNVLAMTFSHRLFPKFRKHQVVDPFGRPQGWGLDMDGDWLAEPYFAYMNPGAKQWGDLMTRVIGELIRTYGIDAVFLDQTLLAFNVSNGPNFVRGMRDHVRRLQHAFPGTLFAGEGLHEQVLSVLPMAQIHGIDSVAEVHALDGAAPWRRAHPVSTYLFGPYTRFVAHLLTKHPSHPMFRLQEAAYAKLGVIPALCLYHRGQAMDSPATRRMLARAKRIDS